MKTQKKEVYYCDYCKKHGLNKSKMEYHEETCFKNPENKRPCFNCHYLEKKETFISGMYSNGLEWERTVNLLHCNKKQHFLYTPKNQFKGNQFDLGDYENNPMPKECEFYDDYSDELLF